MTSSGSHWQPDLVRLQAIHAALGPLVKTTPVFSFGALSHLCGGDVVLKAESLQRTGSFKLRGTSAKLAGQAEQRPLGVVAGSAGNHGQALAYAARAEGLPCTVFMPVDAAVSKVEAVTAFGAQIHLEGRSVDDCVEAARAFAERSGLLLVHPFDDLEIVSGQAGVGIELLDQVPDLARIVVPVGGGGLIGGIAAAVKTARPEVEIVGVQAAGCGSIRASLAAGEPVAVAGAATIADGIAVKRPGRLTLELIERWVDELVEVDDDAITTAMVMLVERAKLVSEGAGAAAVSALASGATAPAEEGTTVAVVSGGNVDPGVLATVLARAETGTGRRRRIFTTIGDRPGSLARLLGTVAAAGGNVLDLTHVRDGVRLRHDQTGVEMVLECRDAEAARALRAALLDAGYPVSESEVG